MSLQDVWFGLITVLILGYALLDGFDLGVGVLYLRVARTDRERRLLLNSIGPVWDGNEVWLLTGGGALFAAFPPVYATVFSGFYLAMMLVLLGLILRAISIEFRSKVESPSWRKTWDRLFSLGSFLPALLFGVAVGNLMRGIPIDGSGEFTGTFPGLLNPYSLLMGILSLAMFTQHGAAYLLLKTEGEPQERALWWAWRAFGVFAFLHLAAVGWSLLEAPYLFERYWGGILPWIPVALLVLSFAAFPHFLKRGQYGRAFAASCGTIGFQIVALAVGAYPFLAPSRTDPAFSLTTLNASSSDLTLKTMLIMALIGVPIVLAYTAWVYWTFRGKARIEEGGY